MLKKTPQKKHMFLKLLKENVDINSKESKNMQNFSFSSG